MTDYLDLTRAKARWQFQTVLNCSCLVSEGERQTIFLPVETLLCFAASYVVNHRKFDDSTAHLEPEPVPLLAQLLCRRPASILAKMANLDNSRPNGGRWDAEVGTRLRDEPQRFARL